MVGPERCSSGSRTYSSFVVHNQGGIAVAVEVEAEEDFGLDAFACCSRSHWQLC